MGLVILFVITIVMCITIGVAFGHLIGQYYMLKTIFNSSLSEQLNITWEEWLNEYWQKSS